MATIVYLVVSYSQLIIPNLWEKWVLDQKPVTLTSKPLLSGPCPGKSKLICNKIVLYYYTLITTHIFFLLLWVSW